MVVSLLLLAAGGRRPLAGHRRADPRRRRARGGGRGATAGVDGAARHRRLRHSARIDLRWVPEIDVRWSVRRRRHRRAARAAHGAHRRARRGARLGGVPEGGTPRDLSRLPPDRRGRSARAPSQPATPSSSSSPSRSCSCRCGCSSAASATATTSASARMPGAASSSSRRSAPPSCSSASSRWCTAGRHLRPARARRGLGDGPAGRTQLPYRGAPVSGLPSRCRSCRCTPGCRRPTRPPPPPARCCSPPSCSRWAPTGSCGSGRRPSRRLRPLTPLLGVAGVVGIVWGALVCLVERDLKRLIAYSSVAHMGFVALATRVAGSATGLQAALFANIAHGIVAGPPLLLVGGLKERWGSVDLAVPRRPCARRSPRLGFLLSWGSPRPRAARPGRVLGRVFSVYAAWSAGAADRPARFRRLRVVLAAIGAALAAAYALRVPAGSGSVAGVATGTGRARRVTRDGSSRASLAPLRVRGRRSGGVLGVCPPVARADRRRGRASPELCGVSRDVPHVRERGPPDDGRHARAPPALLPALGAVLVLVVDPSCPAAARPPRGRPVVVLLVAAGPRWPRPCATPPARAHPVLAAGPGRRGVPACTAVADRGTCSRPAVLVAAAAAPALAARRGPRPRRQRGTSGAPPRGRHRHVVVAARPRRRHLARRPRVRPAARHRPRRAVAAARSASRRRRPSPPRDVARPPSRCSCSALRSGSPPTGGPALTPDAVAAEVGPPTTLSPRPVARARRSVPCCSLAGLGFKLSARALPRLDAAGLLRPSDAPAAFSRRSRRCRRPPPCSSCPGGGGTATPAPGSVHGGAVRGRP